VITDDVRIRFYSACRCYLERDDVTSRGVTWAKWFEKKWGETLSAFFRRAKDADLVEAIAQHEEQTYGETRARDRAAVVRDAMREDRARRLRSSLKARNEA